MDEWNRSHAKTESASRCFKRKARIVRTPIQVPEANGIADGSLGRYDLSRDGHPPALERHEVTHA